MRKFDIQPRIPGSVTIGGNKGESVIVAGRMAEKGESDSVFFDGSENFVVLQVGKRGSGKSYGMGALLEGFATQLTNSRIGKNTTPRGVVLLDPLDIHWTALIPLSPDGPAALQDQYRILERWGGIDVEPISVQVYVPAGYQFPIDHPGFLEYRMPVSEMSADDWALLLRTDLVTEPRGRLLDEAFLKVTRLGWQRERGGALQEAIREYTINDLISCIENDIEIDSLYEPQTRRSVIQPLRSLVRMPLFADSIGTPITEVVRAGVLSIMSLGRLPQDVRTVVSTVFVRKLREDRMYASQILRRLALSAESPEIQRELEAEVNRHVPRTVLAIDEAQILMPSRSDSMARQALESYVLEGRNYGLSLWLATQRPKGAISERAVSQIDTFIVHRLSIAEDIKAVCGLLQSAQPEKIRLAGRELDLAGLIRSLDIGQAIFSSASGNASRLVVAQLRPRVVAHGGEAF
ncbi:ATP-binding protein [Acidobacteriota bacterium]